MIIENLVEKVKKDPATRKKVRTYINDRLDTYYGHDCYKIFRNRYFRLNDSIDMKFNTSKSTSRATNAWRSKIAIPLVREAFLARRAVTLANFVNDPLVTISGDGQTGIETARNMHNVLTSNIRRTQFREKAFNDIINSCSRWGAGIAQTFYRRETTNTRVTVPRMNNGIQIGYERPLVPRTVGGANNKSIDPLNYFQNPNIADPDMSDYRGFLERFFLSEIMAMIQLNPELYIKDEVKKAVDEAKKNTLEDSQYYSNGIVDWNWIGFDTRHWYGKLNIENNESDGRCYYVQMAGDKFLLRIEENPHDRDMIPLATYTFDRRPKFWWGNVDTENVIPHENYLNMFLSMGADNAIRGLQNYIFFNKLTGLNPADLNNRAKSGGFIGYEGKPGQSVRDLFAQFQFPDNGIASGEYMVREIKEAAQRVSSRTDLQRTANEGALQNNTATAANIINAQGNIQENYYLIQFSYGLQTNARNMTTMIQEYAGDKLRVRPDPQMSPIELMKYEILGEFVHSSESSLTTNQQVQAMNLFNAISAIQNFKGSGDPTWQNVNVHELIRKWLKQIVPNTNLDKIVPEQQPQMPQQNPLGGMPVAGPAPAPAQQQPVVA